MVNRFTRRHILSAAAAGCAWAVLSPVARTDGQAAAKVQTLAADESHWRAVAAQYNTTDAVINLENGNWGIMSRPVLAAYQAHTEMVNRENSFYVRRKFGGDFVAIRALLADRLGVGADEIALTRGATEALQNIIGGFNLLNPGDCLMYADLDYDSIQQAMLNKAKRHRCVPVKLNIPEGASVQQIVAFYVEAMERNPRTKLLLLTHISHRTGLLLPVGQICTEARKRGIRTLVDAAHSWGQIAFTASDLQADYAGFNLHKWIGAPIGGGILYIRRDHLADISPNISATAAEAESIAGRVHTGTSNFAACLTIPDALAFHESIGWQQKAERLRYLRNVWVAEVRKIKRLEILTPDDPALHAGITAFRIKGTVSDTGNREICRTLLERFGIFTVHRSGVAAGSCVRITPNVYNSAEQMLNLATALRKMV